MAALSLDAFSRAAYDFEQAQYRVLAGLQRAHRAFAENRIYPHLGELAELHRTLCRILERSADVRRGRPREIERIDLESQRVVYAWPELDAGQLADVETLIEWALPRLRAALDEGRAIYEFVDEHLRLEEVGLVPSYRREGFLLVPDAVAGALHVLRYALSIYDGSGERYRRLKTTFIESVDYDGAGLPPEPRRVKLRLIEKHRDELPHPATYFFDAVVALPFAPTVFPVARRKLMRFLAADAGSGEA